MADTGDSHAPVPLYLSTAGYGVFVDTARAPTFYFASHKLRGESAEKTDARAVITDIEALYATDERSGRVEIDIPVAEGVDLYLFGGPSIAEALQRYVLFSGGGAMPPMWGLGVWYRCYGKFDQTQALHLAERLRERKLPCDVYGLEPGWMSTAYPCSFKWDARRFPKPAEFIRQVTAIGYKINLWEHAFTHATAPFYDAMLPHSGSHEVFSGIVPDFTKPEANELFTHYHEHTLVRPGIAGFKLDECDSSDFNRSPWSFPDHAQFPGGMDGEQYHAVFGTLYAGAVQKAFTNTNRRTLGSVRNLGALASPLPYVLYSDLYGHRDFIRGIATAGISGLLWTPEVRDAASIEDLIRRLQAVVLSPQALINAWYIPLPPWEQFDRTSNGEGKRLPDWEKNEAVVRELLELRMRLLPYLYAAFARYHFDGRPPFRPLVLDYPEDAAVRHVDDQYLIGEQLMAAPMVAGQSERTIVLPHGDWYDFNTHECLSGGVTIQYAADIGRAPLFVKADSILLLAEPVQCVTADTVFDIVPHLFGDPQTPAQLFEDDGETFNYSNGDYCWLQYSASGEITRAGNYTGRERYRIKPAQRI